MARSEDVLHARPRGLRGHPQGTAVTLTSGVSVGEDYDGASFFADPGTGASEYQLDPATAVANRRELLLLSLRESTGRAPLAQQIFDEIAIAIVDGRLRPGQILNSVELARRFQTSRTPVREALAGLERQGVVVVPHRRRPYVAPVTLRQIKDIYDLRASLFTLTAELIVDECPTERLAALWRWQEALEDDVAREAVEDYFWHNVGFRLVEVRLTGNEELQRTVGALGIRTLQFRHVSLSQPVRLRESVAQHRRLLLAYEARDKATATDATRSMIMAGYRFLRQSYLLSEPSEGASTEEEEEPG
jgi:DNA-binding GntR family transcriptional regulator